MVSIGMRWGVLVDGKGGAGNGVDVVGGDDAGSGRLFFFARGAASNECVVWQHVVKVPENPR
eukprot:9451583-Prorocentrum_lima.AAC.1